MMKEEEEDGVWGERREKAIWLVYIGKEIAKEKVFFRGHSGPSFLVETFPCRMHCIKWCIA